MKAKQTSQLRGARLRAVSRSLKSSAIAGVLGAALTLVVSHCAHGQQLVPEWKDNWWPDKRPGVGTNFSWISGNDFHTTICQAADALQASTQDESGEEWYLAHTNVFDPVTHEFLGTAAVGYLEWADWHYYTNYTDPQPEGDPDPQEMETPARRHFEDYRAAVVMYDPQGNVLWWRALHLGKFQGVVFDPNGYIVATGYATDYTNAPDMIPSQLDMQYNPVVGQPATTLAGTGAIKLIIDKFDLNGNALWSHIFNKWPSSDPRAQSERTEGVDIDIVNTSGSIGYRAVGYQGDYFAAGGPGVGLRPYIVDVNGNGELVDMNHMRVFDDVPGQFDGLGAGHEGYCRANGIARYPGANGDLFAITGFRTPSTQDRSDAWLMLIDDSNNPGDPLHPVGPLKIINANTDHAVLETYVNYNETIHSNAWSVNFAADGKIIWPMIADYTSTIFVTRFNREARGLVYKIDWSGANPVVSWATDLGPVRGYDLQTDAIATADGNVAFAATKLSAPFTNAAPLTSTWLHDNDPAIYNGCLLDPNGLGYQDTDGGTPGIQPIWSRIFSPFPHLEQWSTDLYCAKLSGATGALLFQGTYDNAEGGPRVCAPGDLKQKECIFKLSEAPDGCLIMSGNSGANFEDSYIVAIMPLCDAQADYTYFDSHYPLDANHEFHVTGNLTWSVSMAVHGSIIIDPGATLTINNNAVIQFADSRKVGYTTNIVVRAQSASPFSGNLVVTDGATLTSLLACPTSMWDGIRVLGLGTGVTETLSNQGEFRISNNATISNALTAVTNCAIDPYQSNTGTATQAGGIIIAEKANFLNNRFDVVMRKYNSNQANDATNSRFYQNRFEITGPLNYADDYPQARLWFDQVNRMKVGGNGFFNTWGIAHEAPDNWGEGIHAFNTAIQVLPMCGNLTGFGGSCNLNSAYAVNTFQGMLRGISFATTMAIQKTPNIKDNQFEQNGGAIYINSGYAAKVDRNTVAVYDLDLSTAGLTADYGIGIWNCTGFEVENNVISGPGLVQNLYPTVGMVFSNTGVNTNRYYNNTFGNLSEGTIIQHTNDGPLVDDGLDFKCNDYGSDGANWNYYDIAFTSSDVSVGDRQGSPSPNVTAPAGNTFSGFCNSPETQLFVPQQAINTFTYWHHDPASTAQIVFPTCRTNPPLMTSWFVNSGQLYQSKVTACPGYIELINGGQGQRMAMSEAEEQRNTLKQVYDSERDGGNTEGLKEVVYDANTSSYDVRNALMLAAPKVSIEVWKAVFNRDPELNPWHLAQALLANSPLQPEVVRMMEASNLTPFYKDLVNGGQNGGVNTLTIMESELAHFRHQHEGALNDLVADALQSADPAVVDDVLAWEEDHPQMEQPYARIALHLARGEAEAALAVADPLLAADGHDGALDVLGLYLQVQVAGLGIEAVDPEQAGMLREIAERNGPGSDAAKAWLQAIGLSNEVEEIVLPREERALQGAHERIDVGQEPILSVYPSPASAAQPLYLVVRLPEGMDQATVRIVDPLGRSLREQRLSGNTGIVEIAPRELATGLYTAGVFAEGVQVGTTKFEVLH